MGTRNLTLIRHNGLNFGQYGQYDGYPSGQGAIFHDFICHKFDKEKFIQRYMKSKIVDARSFIGEIPETLNRNTGARILELIQEGSGELVLSNSVAFVSDSLFCEWAYMLDLDCDMVRVFEGFNKKPLHEDEMFSFYQGLNGYHPIRETFSVSIEKFKRMGFKTFAGILVLDSEV